MLLPFGHCFADEKRPSIAELSAQKARLKDLEGWKLTRMISNLDSLVSIEALGLAI